MNKRLLTLKLFVLFLVFSMSACGKKAKDDSPTMNVTAVRSSSVASVSAIEEKEPEVEKKYSLLTGKEVKNDKKRPYAFMFNNINFAYPQTGTGRAGILYEILAEGGITRLMGVFDNMKGDRIGSVRSARHYYVDFAKEFDAIFIHFGQTHYAIDEIKKLGVDTISGLSYEGNKAFYRDRNIRAPHNAFASKKGIDDAMKLKKYRKKIKDGIPPHFKFSYDKEIENNSSIKAERVTIPFSAYMTPYFTYDTKDKLYTRFAFGVKHIDKGTGKALKFKNIFIQFVNEYDKDRNGYQTMDLIGKSGEGYYLTNGKAIKVYWNKPSSNEKTSFYYDKAHKEEIAVNVGKTYYAVFPRNRKDKLTFNK